MVASRPVASESKAGSSASWVPTIQECHNHEDEPFFSFAVFGRTPVLISRALRNALLEGRNQAQTVAGSDSSPPIATSNGVIRVASPQRKDDR